MRRRVSRSRARKVRAIERSARRAVESFRSHDSRTADQLEALADRAAHLLRRGDVSQAELNELSAEMPSSPAWMDPRHGAFDAERDQWQLEAADRFRECDALAIDLRVTGRSI